METASALPAGPNRMADPIVRRQVALVIAVLLGLAWTAVRVVGQPSGAFTNAELPHVSGLPFPPPQVERRIAPPAGELDLSDLQDLQRAIRGVPGTPAPGSTPPKP